MRRLAADDQSVRYGTKPFLGMAGSWSTRWSVSNRDREVWTRPRPVLRLAGTAPVDALAAVDPTAWGDGTDQRGHRRVGAIALSSMRMRPRPVPGSSLSRSPARRPPSYVASAQGDLDAAAGLITVPVSRTTTWRDVHAAFADFSPMHWRDESPSMFSHPKWKVTLNPMPCCGSLRRSGRRAGHGRPGEGHVTEDQLVDRLPWTRDSPRHGTVHGRRRAAISPPWRHVPSIFDPPTPPIHECAWSG